MTMLRHLAASMDHGEYFIHIYHVSEGYLRNIPIERRGKYPGNRYFSQITLTNRIYLFNSAEYLTASKTVACMQAGSEIQTTSII